ncbi:MAG: hypothetical protein ACHQ0J_15375 [Candidatus Dormibacterales bacterium]
MNDLWRVAYHEAAHAILAECHQVPVSMVSVHPPATWFATEEAGAYALAVIAMGGPIMDRRFDHEQDAEDKLIAAEQVSTLVDDTDAEGTDLQYMEIVSKHAAQVLERNWTAVELLADELVESVRMGSLLPVGAGTVPGSRVRELIHEGRLQGPKRTRWTLLAADLDDDRESPGQPEIEVSKTPSTITVSRTEPRVAIDWGKLFHKISDRYTKAAAKASASHSGSTDGSA